MTPGYRDGLLTAIIVGLMLAAGWLAYQPALSGTFLLDDVSNLGDIQHVDDADSALHFVLSGSSGPVGRPLALASFLPQADEWKQGAQAFLVANISVHILNACLVGAFLYLLSRARGIAPPASRFIALAAMALWLFMPLLASSTLMVVQRMTTLSATFVLLGLILYLMARRRVELRAGAALAGMSAALVVATLLAVLTKESGALLPVLVLVLEGTLLDPPTCVRPGRWRAWMGIFLLLPAALILGYLITRLPYSEPLVLRRDFSGAERLLTEARILWEYLLNGFLPRPGQFGPFHDGYPVAETLLNPLTIAAVIGWIVVTSLAFVWRRKFRLFAFAVLWFVGGHLLESTTLALELYFEHRNYIPMIGPVYALCGLAAAVPDRYRTIARVGLPLYISVNALFLVSLTTLWGDPAVAARVWHERFPESSRALTALATRQLEAEGPAAAVRTLRTFVARKPEHAYIGIPILSLSCIIAPDADHASSIEPVRRLLPRADFSYTAATMLSDLISTTVRTDCRGVDLDAVESLVHALVSNPRYAADPGYLQLHHQLLASIARHSGDTEATLGHLRQAMEYKRDSRLNMMVVTTLVTAGRFDDAREFVEEVSDDMPVHPLKRWLWHRELAELTSYVEESEKASAREGSGNPGAGANG